MNVRFLRGTQANYDALRTSQSGVSTETLYYTTDDNNFYIGSHQLNNDALDVDEFALASIDSGDIITINGIKEVDGKIVVGTDNTKKISFAKVAKTGAAEDVTTTAITDGDATDPKTLYPAGNVQGVLESIGRKVDTLSDTSVVTVEKLATATTGYLASYIVKQNDTQVGATIDIPKDFLVKSVSVETWDGQGTPPVAGMSSGDKYIDFVVNVKEGTAEDTHLYIAVNDLVHPISGGTTTVANEYELQVSVSATNEITATLNNIYGAKVQYVPVSATTKLTNVTNVKDALDAIDTLVQGMDADLDATSDTTVTDAEKIPVITGVTEVDGVITAVDSVDVDLAGAATRAKEAVIGQSTDAKTADTIKGVKRYIGTIPTDPSTGADVAADVISYINQKTGDGISSLDSTADIASVSNNVVTIKGGLVETDGIVTNAPTSGDGAKADITLEEVAVTGAAADVSIADSGSHFTGETVEAALTEIGNALTWGTF